jgi:opacity protein-like surface antigen
MNFKKIALVAAIVASSSAAMAGEGFYAAVGAGAVGTSVDRTEFGAADMNLGQTNTVGVIDAGYAMKMGSNWDLGFGASYDMGTINAGHYTDTSVSPNTGLTVTAKNHYSVYVQPSFNLSATTAVFGKIGFNSIAAEVVDADGKNDSLSFQGLGYGFGVKTMASKNVYVQAEVLWVDYKAISDAVDSNKLKTTTGLFSIGYQF